MNTKSSVVTLVVVAVAIIGVSFFLKPTINVGVSPTPVTVNVPEQPAPIVNVSTPSVRVPAPVVNVPQQPPILGSVSGPDLFSPYWNVNGFYEWPASRVAMNSASTTLCSFKSPTTGTSTLTFASAELASSTVAAYRVTFAKDTVSFGSTTPIGNDLLYAAGTQSTSIATTTATGGNPLASSLIFAPGTYLNVTLAASDAGLFSPRGWCKVQFTSTGRN